MSGERDVLERLLDYDSCHDGDVDDAVVEIRSLRRQVATLREACRKTIAMHDSLFTQCLSNTVRNAWGKDVDMTLVNEAYNAARAALAETEETPE